MEVIVLNEYKFEDGWVFAESFFVYEKSDLFSFISYLYKICLKSNLIK